jgi:outer membrane protein assembly factor BamE (lipoprotein component of BamABCDE complex)
MKTASRKNPKKPMALLIIFSTLPLLLACLGSQSLGSNNQNGRTTDPESIEGQGATHSFAQSCLGGIVLGVTTREEVIAALGQPSVIENEGDVETLYYSSSTKGIFNFVLVENEVAHYTSKLLGEEDVLRLSGIFEQLGEPEYLAYSHFVAGSRTYVYPQHGVLFIADPNMDTVFIQECFPPQDLARFLATYGQNLPEENPYTK